jgi:hypothetical protein
MLVKSTPGVNVPIIGEMCRVDRFVMVLARPAVLPRADEDVWQEVENLFVLKVKVAQFAVLKRSKD